MAWQSNERREHTLIPAHDLLLWSLHRAALCRQWKFPDVHRKPGDLRPWWGHPQGRDRYLQDWSQMKLQGPCLEV